MLICPNVVLNTCCLRSAPFVFFAFRISPLIPHGFSTSAVHSPSSAQPTYLPEFDQRHRPTNRQLQDASIPPLPSFPSARCVRFVNPKIVDAPLQCIVEGRSRRERESEVWRCSELSSDF